MKRFAASAVAIAIATGATGVMAEQHMGMGTGMVAPDQYNSMIRAESIIGADIYTLQTEYDEAGWLETGYYNEIDTDWKEIGEIEDIVLSRDGKMIGLVAEVGGWLDIGDSEVIISLDDVKMVGDPGIGNDVAFVTRLSEEQMENMEPADEAWWR